jgi:hypothetical protein
MNGVGLAVDFDTHFAAGGIGAQVDAGGKESAHEAAGIVMAPEGFTGKLDEGGLGPVGDELDGVDKVFSAATQLGDALLGWEVFEFDVFGGGFAPGFEVIEPGLPGLQVMEGRPQQGNTNGLPPCVLSHWKSRGDFLQCSGSVSNTDWAAGALGILAVFSPADLTNPASLGLRGGFLLAALAPALLVSVLFLFADFSARGTPLRQTPEAKTPKARARRPIPR